VILRMKLRLRLTVGCVGEYGECSVGQFEECVGGGEVAYAGAGTDEVK
jgi:hypothetical protein